MRTVLAGHEIDQIMLDCSRFGEAFTKEVQPHLGGWGVEAIKNIELMAIRDAKDSDVIHNIMAKRTSGIERESRLVVADNSRQDEMAEIAAKREIEMSRQLAAEQVGLRTAEKDKNLGVAIVQADAARQVAIVSAEGNKQQTVLTTEGKLEAAKRNAEGIAVEGEAKGSAETASSGQVRCQLKTSYRDGTTRIALEPLDLMARRAALVPPPRMHLTRFHGVFAPHSKLRAAVTPAHRGVGSQGQGDQATDKPITPRHVAMSWAQRLKRVLGIDIETCTGCGGKLKVIARTLAHIQKTALDAQQTELP